MIIFVAFSPSIMVVIFKDYTNPIFSIPFSFILMILVVGAVMFIISLIRIRYSFIEKNIFNDVKNNFQTILLIASLYTFIGTIIAEFLFAFNYSFISQVNIDEYYVLLPFSFSFILFIRIVENEVVKNLKFIGNILLETIMILFILGFIGISVFSLNVRPPSVDFGNLLLRAALYGIIFSLLDFIIFRIINENKKVIKIIDKLLENIEKSMKVLATRSPS